MGHGQCRRTQQRGGFQAQLPVQDGCRGHRLRTRTRPGGKSKLHVHTPKKSYEIFNVDHFSYSVFVDLL